MSGLKVNRRRFVAGSAIAAGGLVLGVYPSLRAATSADAPQGLQPNAWLRITPDDRVIFQLDKTEMGQGVSTSLPTIIAEELEIDPRRIVVEPALVDKTFQDPMQITGGSASVHARWDALRKTGAQAREMLVAAAAARWGVSPDACRAENGRVVRVGTDASFSYGELANDAAKVPVPKEPRLKDPSQFEYVGKPLRRFDAVDKSNGKAKFGIDVDMPDLTIAVLVRNPHFGGTLASFDADAARKSPGIVDVFEQNGSVAVVADTYWHALKAAKLVDVKWNKGPLAGLDSSQIRAQAAEFAKNDGRTIRDDGDVAAAVKAAASVHEVVYEVPYLAHATMEPQNTTAVVRPDGTCEIWSPQQGPDATQALVAHALGISRDKVVVRTMLMGGGFGRRGIPDFAPEAALVARRVKRPVKVIWTREDDMRHDYYRPATYNVMSAALDEKGQALSWSHKIVAPSMFRSLLPLFGQIAPQWIPDWVVSGATSLAGPFIKTRDSSTTEGAADEPYAIPNVDVQHVFYDPGVPLGFWRSVGHSQNAFVVESFIDELAHAAGEDPYRYRRRLLAGHPRHLAVLDLVAEKADWGRRPGTFQGIAVHESFGSVVAEVAEVSVTNHVIRVDRVVCAVDCGLVVNPDQVAAQVESAVVFGLTAALKGRITIKDGAVEQSNFHDYPLLRMNETPAIEVYTVPSKEHPTGIGEPGTPPLAPAVANAVFVATGQRLRSLPLTLGV